MMEGVKELRERLEQLEKKGGGGGESRRDRELKLRELEVGTREEREGGGKQEKEELKEAIGRVERRIEAKEREQRKRNVVVRGVKAGKGEEKEKVEEIMRGIGIEGGIEEVMESREERGREGSRIVIAKMKSIEKKREVLRKKKGLRDREIWIEEDLTWEERRIQWKLRGIARDEARKGKRVWVGKGGIKVNEEWWMWDEGKGRISRGGRTAGNQEGEGEVQGEKGKG